MSTRTYRMTIPAETRGWGENKRVLPAQVVQVELYINEEALAAELGRKAARSKGKRTTALAGKVKCKLVRVVLEAAA